MGPQTINFVGVDLFIPLLADPLPLFVADSMMVSREFACQDLIRAGSIGVSSRPRLHKGTGKWANFSRCRWTFWRIFPLWSLGIISKMRRPPGCCSTAPTTSAKGRVLCPKYPFVAPANAHFISRHDAPISPQKLSTSHSDSTGQWKALVEIHEHVLKDFDELQNSVFTEFCVTCNLGSQQPESKRREVALPWNRDPRLCDQEVLHTRHRHIMPSAAFCFSVSCSLMLFEPQRMQSENHCRRPTSRQKSTIFSGVVVASNSAKEDKCTVFLGIYSESESESES